MTLDPQAASLRDLLAAAGMPPLREMGVTAAREAALGLVALQGEPEEVASVTDINIRGPVARIPVRVYRPSRRTGDPLIVYFHGGGWVIGSIEVVDRPCRALANITGCVVASVEYRLAPESKFPAAVEDSYAATTWLAQHAGELGAEAGPIVVAGDSAGANLATVTAMHARDGEGPPIAMQVLVYPVTAAPGDPTFASYTDAGEGYMLTADDMHWFWDHYCRSPEDASDSRAAPLRAENLAGLPPTLVVLAGYDPLRDEGLAYAARLQVAGVDATVRLFDGQMHGFFWAMGVVDAAREAMKEIASAVSGAQGKE